MKVEISLSFTSDSEVEEVVSDVEDMWNTVFTLVKGGVVDEAKFEIHVEREEL